MLVDQKWVSLSDCYSFVCQSGATRQSMNRSNSWPVDLSITSLWVSLPISTLSVHLSFAGLDCLSVCLSINFVNFASQFPDHWSVCWSLVCGSVCESVSEPIISEPVDQLASIFVYLVFESACKSVGGCVCLYEIWWFNQSLELFLCQFLNKTIKQSVNQ